MTNPAARIVRANAADARRHADDLGAVLIDAVASNASVSFVHPLSPEEATRYWHGVADDVAAEAVVLLVALIDARAVGTVQLHPVHKPNQPHRAEVAKLLVHRDARGHGIGGALMRGLEDEARALGRSLLTLDTDATSPAPGFYRRLGFQPAGVIPGFALNGHGTALVSTLYMWKRLDSDG